MDYKNYLLPAIEAALHAGQAIMEVYSTDFSVEKKEDSSPLTLADKRSHEIICAAFEKFSLPVLSEEGKEIPYETRKNWEHFWLIDPLDGTKEFVKRNGEFTVNIALIRKHRPVLGIIYAPVKNLFYYACEGLGAFRMETTGADSSEKIMQQAQKLPLKTDRNAFTVVASRSHLSVEVNGYLNDMKLKHREVVCISSGSSIKLCLVAENSADAYPRFGPTMEWDTGAGQAIAEQAGKQVIDHSTGKPMVYNKENLRNNWFIVQ